jgi:Protein of unknown function (DUF2750)
MSWEIAEGEAAQLVALPAADRALTFFQLAADWEEVWGLKDADGWLVARETDSFPLWPHAVFAEACAREAWAGALPEPLPVDDLLEDLLPLLEEDGLRVAVFPTPEDPGALMTPGEVRDRLEAELEIGGE